ncbi:30S ribosomal protein S5 [Candidatus Wolfebacteria bacterium]|nr:30S ribosomal protein S5 [Candidatus Wolfebacteria bacterium]
MNKGFNKFNKVKSEYKDKVIDLRRVTRVMAGGKRFRFRATVIIGDEKGRVGVGIAKGLDVAQAVEKAKSIAKKSVITVPLVERTILHEVEAKFSAADIIIKPAKKGHGLKAGGAVRQVLLLVGVRDATAKCLGRTKNKLTNAMATLEALKKFKIKKSFIKEEPSEEKNRVITDEKK